MTRSRSSYARFQGGWPFLFFIVFPILVFSIEQRSEAVGTLASPSKATITVHAKEGSRDKRASRLSDLLVARGYCVEVYRRGPKQAITVSDIRFFYTGDGKTAQDVVGYLEPSGFQLRATSMIDWRQAKEQDPGWKSGEGADIRPGSLEL